ncbi:MAG: hypothetical protein H5T49_00160 [Hadesarchaea archaeon]|nr:hypothetical protein [Hadesarchaea archaeon]
MVFDKIRVVEPGNCPLINHGHKNPHRVILILTQSVFDNEVRLDFSTLRIVLSRHPEMAKVKQLDREVISAVSEPDYVLAGRHGENIAVRRIAAGFLRGGCLLVPYREGGEVCTVSAAKREKPLGGRLILWKR